MCNISLLISRSHTAQTQSITHTHDMHTVQRQTFAADYRAARMIHGCMIHSTTARDTQRARTHARTDTAQSTTSEQEHGRATEANDEPGGQQLINQLGQPRSGRERLTVAHIGLDHWRNA